MPGWGGIARKKHASANMTALRTLVLLAHVLSSLGGDDQGCELLTAQWGHVQSENGRYGNLVMRCWLLQPAGAARVRLSFKSFQTEPDFDIVRIYDGPNTSSALIGQYSGNDLPHPLDSAGPSLYLTFSSDWSNRRGGFTFAWTSDDRHALADRLCAVGCDRITDLNNSHCDPACYNAQCYWDGGDCHTACNVTESCTVDQLGDGTCDPNCLNADCSFDQQDCACENVLTQPYGYMSDGTDATSDYASLLHKCWLFRPEQQTGA
jgi:hypothetical protein